MLIGDACCFLGERGKDPLAQKDLMLNFGVATATPPTVPLENKKGGRPLTMKETLDKVGGFKNSIINQERLRLVFGFSDLVEATNNKQTGVVLGLQNTPSDAEPEALFEAGIRIMAIAYYGQNQYGSGFANAEIGLTEDGRNLIRRYAEAGMIIDVSHAGHQTMIDAISFIEENRIDCQIMASHGGCVSVSHHLRNISDEAMKGIIRLEGVVGITTITFNLDERDNSINPFIRHLSHALKICGENNVCIGTDSVYVKRTLKEAEEGIKKLRPWLDPLDIQGIRYPENIYEGPDLMQKIYKDLRDEAGFTDPYIGFVQGHFTNDQIKQIIGQNMFDFFH
ncbi:MAG: membrane dipeptidase, partial [Patescibacteria group bacterium]|nr:membrane dipeptidase [Patescibacteria group bacterium]